jgi:alkanesulfonate monooxygenase SsuD/methylene tetrahydromethanopterin reductase-like flavin-dependent oxidoreductase (luciferase family)
MPVSSPTSLVVAAAASTHRIKLGATVSVLSTDDPIRVFQQLATAAAIAPGRIDVVAGRGWSDITFSIRRRLASPLAPGAASPIRPT